jgi:hypothetical protein
MIGSKFLAKLSPRERLSGGLAVAVLVAVGFDMGLIRPALLRLDEFNRGIALENRRLDVSRQALAPEQRRAADDAFRRYSVFIEKRKSASEVGARLMEEIETLAGKAQLTLIGSKPRDPRPSSLFEEHAVEVEVEGEFSSLIAFLHGLQSQPDLLRVQKLVLAPKSKDQPAVVKSTILITKLVAM